MEATITAEEFLKLYAAGKRDFGGANLAGINLADKILVGAKFPGANLTNCDLSNSDATDADFCDSNLSGVIFAGAKLANAKFARSTLKTCASFKNVRWKGANLSFCDLSGLDLREAWLAGVVAVSADFSDCNLAGVRLDWASLQSALFCNADLRFAHLRGAHLREADFQNADLRRVRRILFDANNLNNAKISSRSQDPWTALRRQYSGSRLVFHMFLLIAFFLQYVVQVMVWTRVTDMETTARSLVQRVSENAKDKVDVPPGIERRVAAKKCLAAECREWRIWELLLAKRDGPFMAIVAVMLLSYNLARLIMTWRVGPLKDDEDRSRITPALEEYSNLSKLHRFISVLFFVSISSLVYHATDVLFFHTVWLPK